MISTNWGQLLWIPIWTGYSSKNTPNQRVIWRRLIRWLYLLHHHLLRTTLWCIFSCYAGQINKTNESFGSYYEGFWNRCFSGLCRCDGEVQEMRHEYSERLQEVRCALANCSYRHRSERKWKDASYFWSTRFYPGTCNHLVTYDKGSGRGWLDRQYKQRVKSKEGCSL